MGFKRKGGRKPCLTPTVELKRFPVTLLIKIAIFELVYNDYIISTISLLIPKFRMI